MGSDDAFGSDTFNPEQRDLGSQIPDHLREKCISCGGNTPYAITAPIDCRYNYVDGAGQLCADCYQRIYGK